MKSLTGLGFGPHTYLIEDQDLPFEVDSSSAQETFEMLTENTLKEEEVKAKKTIDKKKVSKVESSLERLIQGLKEKKIHLLRWDDPKTHTIYLKMDWGVLSTIRISDQVASGKYTYKYNVILGAKKGAVKQENGITREYYTLREMKALISSIEIEREEKIHKYGRANYQKYMLANKQKAKSQKGFFEGAKEI
mgnify:CR=1 FL=1